VTYFLPRSLRWRRASVTAVVVGLALAVALLVAEAHRRHALYWYDARQDYVYDFGAGHSAVLPVQPRHDGFLLPEWDDHRHTAFLKLHVSSSLGGWWFEPCIEMRAGKASERQCFERGAKGVRYLLLPTAADRPGREITLRGHHIEWDAGSAKVVLFDSPDFTNKRLLVLAPHPDDAEIAAFGLYSTQDSFVVTMTAGNYVDGLYDHLRVDRSAQDALRGDVRTWDSLVVPQWGGVPPERSVNLGYLTNSLQTFYEAATSASAPPDAAGKPVGRYRQGAVQELLGGRTATATWDSVVQDLVTLLTTVRPDFIVAPHPAMDAAADHQYTTVALLAALEQLHDDRTTLLLYTNHHVLAEYFPFGPSDAMVTLPPWFGGARFAGVYSHNLDSAAQLRKLFALEAMHDLRAPPLRLTGGPGTVLAQRLQQAAELLRRDPAGDYSYFRRAVRPNELFFVYPPGEREPLESFLKSQLMH